MFSLQKVISLKMLLSLAFVGSLTVFMPTESFSAPTKKRLEIIIGGDNFCKDDKDCSGASFCHMGSHICIDCPPPFEWVNGTQCVCPKGTVPTADGEDCVECLDDTNCTTLKGDASWYCDTGTLTAGTAIDSYDVKVNSDSSMVAKNIYYCNEIRVEVQGNKIQKCL
jgi:hypothetical protein